MTGNNCLLDTSIIIHSFRKLNNVSARLNTFNTIYVSAVAVGELYYGAYNSGDVTRHLTITNSFLQHCIILPVDNITADIFGSIKASLTKKGKPIPENDIWIAATALQHNLALYTADNHFKEVAGLAFV